MNRYLKHRAIEVLVMLVSLAVLTAMLAGTLMNATLAMQIVA